MNRYYFAFATALALLAASGCGSGPPVGTVTGTVTMDGAPLPNALVTFVPEGGGQPAMGKTDATGKYELYRRGEAGALIGTHTVVVTTAPDPAAAPATEIASDSAEYEKQAMGGAASDYNRATVKESIPARYNSQSQLKHEVKSGKNEINLELTSQ